MRPGIWCAALATIALAAPLSAQAAPLHPAPAGKTAIVSVDERLDRERREELREEERSGSSVASRCDRLAHEEREIREGLEHERDRPDRERLRARLHEVEHERMECERR